MVDTAVTVDMADAADLADAADWEAAVDLVAVAEAADSEIHVIKRVERLYPRFVPAL
jgi:hypothetical protein